ncbi:25114_t:CDS:2, partial [Racocetra persica]
NKNLLSAHNHNPSKTYENKEEKEKNHRHFIFPRKLLEAETDKILAKQSEYYPQLRNNFHEILRMDPVKQSLKTKKSRPSSIEKSIIFSKIGGLEIKEIGAEKKKSGTFRQQLEKFLKELQIKPRFPTGIEFKVSFLDYLKEDKNFYSVLGKDCPSQFYLNYEDYQKTVFYQMGEIIFADISPWRRKDKLTELAEKYSLEPFSDCLSRLEKYYNEKSPAAVSF